MLTWFGVLHGGAEEQVAQSGETPVILRVRTISDGHLARLYLSDGRRIDVAWDTILMACEPRYEHYGGLTEVSRQLTARGTDETGSFE
jgi:hypothetical protein